MTLTLLLAVVDGMAAAAVFVLVSILRFDADPTAKWSVGVDVTTASLLFALAWVTGCWLLGLYRLRVRWGLWAEARDLSRATVTVAAVTLSLLFLFHEDNVSRLFLGMLFVIEPSVALSLRAVLRAWFGVLRRSGRNPTYMLIAGTGILAEDFANRIEAHRSLGIRVIGHLTLPRKHLDASEPYSAEQVVEQVVSRPILGSIDDMHDIFRRMIVDADSARGSAALTPRPGRPQRSEADAAVRARAAADPRAEPRAGSATGAAIFAYGAVASITSSTTDAEPASPIRVTCG